MGGEGKAVWVGVGIAAAPGFGLGCLVACLGWGRGGGAQGASEVCLRGN